MYKVDNSTQKYLLYKQFVAWNYNGCLIASITDYINNSVYQGLPEESEYFSTSDEMIYLDLRTSHEYTKEMENWIVGQRR